MLHDIHETLQRLQAGNTNSVLEIERSIDISKSVDCEHVFVRTMFDEARTVASSPESREKPLAGLAVSVKDLFDVAEQRTSAGSRILQDAEPAVRDSTAVARLRQAGAAFLGRTNMSEFAFSGVGTNPHFGTPCNPCSSDVPRIPGGSSSGAAVSVATGAAFIGLGSDTGGSIRIPAALTGIVGFKSTARLIPNEGVLPLSTTLDTVCALTRSVSDAVLAHEILAQRRVVRNATPLASYRLGVVSTVMLDGMDATVNDAWQSSLASLRNQGARISELVLPEIRELQKIQSSGGFSAAESYAWHHPLITRNAAAYDPRVAARIQRGSTMSARDYIELTHERRDWIHRMTERLESFDAILSPTVPMVAPPIADVSPGAERDEAFFVVNALLLRNTSVINMLDGCAISIPCHSTGELPVGLMIWAGALGDDKVLNIALQVEDLLRRS